ncbi:MAG: bacteriohemerythrin [Magnetococcales bacterium]|nr:bacteriohemerythrin [Magnetococcales bacterium]
MSIRLELLPEEYRLGHLFIDSQHEILFQLFRELSEYCSNAEYALDLEIILGSLETYVDSHFRYEEGLMETSSYKDIDAHRELHHVLEKQVVEKIKKFNALSDRDDLVGFAREMQEFLSKWLQDHIAETDRKFCHTLQ